jgi:hypothetical protein
MRMTRGLELAGIEVREGAGDDEEEAMDVWEGVERGEMDGDGDETEVLLLLAEEVQVEA